MIDVIGCFGAVFSLAGAEALKKAEKIVGAEYLLRENRVSGEKLDGAFLANLPEFLERNRNRRVAFCVSGDPLYHGLGKTLLKHVAPEEISFYPAVTAFQHFFAKLKQPWENAEFISLHGETGGVPFRRILRAGLCAVYGDAKRPAHRIARELLEAFPGAGSRRAAVGCEFGFPGETIIRGTLAELAETETTPLSVLALLPDADAALPDLPLGLADSAYEHSKNMITHPEVRAVALSKLRLCPGTLWDLGAGSGAVGLEAAGLCPGLTVFSVEKDHDRFLQLQNNLRREGLANAIPVENRIELCWNELPSPDRVFLGGGASELLEPCFERLRPGGFFVATAVMVEKVAALCEFRPEARQELLTLNVSRAKTIPAGEMFSAENPITLAVYRKDVL